MGIFEKFKKNVVYESYGFSYWDSTYRPYHIKNGQIIFLSR